MNRPSTQHDPTAAPNVAQRFHAWLMPDYNRPAAIYWWTVVVLGLAVAGFSVVQVAGMPASSKVLILAGTAIAMLAGLFPVRIPGSKNAFAAGEIFMFLLLLLFGPAAAALAAAGEALLGSWRASRRWTSRIISPCSAALSMFISGALLQELIARLQALEVYNDGILLVATMLFSVVYFIVNTFMISAVPKLKGGQPLRLDGLFSVFSWVGLAYAGSSALASLLYLAYRTSGIVVLAGVVPVLATLLVALHFAFRQQEVNVAAQRAAEEAASREAAAQERHLRELEASERRFHSAFTHASIGMALVSFDGGVLQTNTAMCELLGKQPGELARHNLAEVVDPEDLTALTAKLGQLKDGSVEDIALELRFRHSGGAELWVAAHGSLFSEPGSATPCLILQAHDISARRRAEAGLQHIAFHDSLTGLPNRRRFHELLAQAVDRSRVGARPHFAVMFLDFDRFKLINDSLGHSAGDDFLVQVSQRIRSHLRPCDVVARLGGDEFAVLINDVQHDDEAVRLAERLQTTLRVPFHVQGTELSTSASIGITCSTIGDRSPEDVLRDADIAMYKAKAAGKARHAVFDVGLHAEVSRRLLLEGDLRRAIGDGQLEVHYQPMFHLGTGKLLGFEALARWSHPDLGPVGPDVFIPIAEETGLVTALTDFVLATACGDLRRWQYRDLSLANLRMQVNVSGRDLAHASFVARVRDALAASGVSARHLTLELTENILMKQIESAVPMLTELRKLGVSISVDDFGTGYSSLSHLTSLPIDSLKVDRSFVSDLHGDARKSAVVQAVVTLGNSLGKLVVAEGIENDSQLDELCDLGCDMGQGYHLSRPLAPEAVDELLSALLAEPGRERMVRRAPAAVSLH